MAGVRVRLGELLAAASDDVFVGRTAELAVLNTLLEPEGPLAVLVAGIGGIGKSTLLRRFVVEARRQRSDVVVLDCRTFEPTERGFLAALADATGGPPADQAALWDRLGRSRRCVVALDGFEHVALLDTWVRHQVLPSLPATCRLLVCARQLPLAAWGASGAAVAPVRAMELRPLSPDEASDLLCALGASAVDVEPIAQFARGHPLALTVAAAAATARPRLPLAATAFPAVVEELTAQFLVDVDRELRESLDAAGLVRRVTFPLLAAMIGDDAAGHTFERLRRLPFVESSGDGLFLHETVQQALTADLEARDLLRRRRLRTSAWQHLRHVAATSSRSELWRCTADMLFLVENPVLREAFFPSNAPSHVVEPAKAGDPAVERLIQAEEQAPIARWLLRWWRERPDGFSVARSRDGSVEGVYGLLRWSDAASWAHRHDPVWNAWRRHLDQEPVPAGSEVLLALRWLSAGRGDLPSPAQAAMWLDIKRAYMELRPNLARLYGVVGDFELYRPVVSPLGFKAIGPLELDCSLLTACVLDFGPGSVDAWLSRLVASELDVQIDEAEVLGLTPLEAGTWRYLVARPGRGVSRAELIEQVWGSSYNGGSNVVDAVVRTLRSKLGERRSQLETVRGVGYRYRP